MHYAGRTNNSIAEPTGHLPDLCVSSLSNSLQNLGLTVGLQLLRLRQSQVSVCADFTPYDTKHRPLRRHPENDPYLVTYQRTSGETQKLVDWQPHMPVTHSLFALLNLSLR
jgi:hypothetical protein